MSNDYLLRRRGIKQGLVQKQGPKEPKPLKPISDKKAEEMKGGKSLEKLNLDKWFEERRRGLTGVCQCGCGRKSSKNDDLNYRASCCHVFPKSIFKSIALHPLNCVERNFWDGCHSNMDNRSLDLWPQFADWDDIKERFHNLTPLLTDEERSHKFYKHLEKLVYEN